MWNFLQGGVSMESKVRSVLEWVHKRSCAHPGAADGWDGEDDEEEVGEDV